MATNSASSISEQLIPIFNGDRYEFWSIKMKTLFKSSELWDLVENGYAEEDEAQRLRENKKKDSKALFYIQQAMHDSVFSRIAVAETSTKVWDILKKEFHRSTKVMTFKLQSLRRDFENSFMKSSESVQDYLSRVSTIVNHMKAYGDKIIDETVIAKGIRSLNKRFDHVVAAIEESHNLFDYCFDELMSSLQAHEDRLNASQEKGEEKAFQINGESSVKGKSEVSNSRGCRGRGSFRGRVRGRGQA
ncbi:uncharacterized protein LOC124899617 [Capsicum annuum]|uniref:uncharacterized protein LOC124899617 n=1 Tax=Capsicum annuum TaxID=4072 RepID=UPI001FB138B8|nr:uncharacterized protein LOC124899617 [Capsicum annuum]